MISPVLQENIAAAVCPGTVLQAHMQGWGSLASKRPVATPGEFGSMHRACRGSGCFWSCCAAMPGDASPLRCSLFLMSLRSRR